jgi:uncharacterized membrane protein
MKFDKTEKSSQNWYYNIFYFNPADKRIFPPKRISPFGWTINFANIKSICAFAGLCGILFLLIFIFKFYEK